MVNLLAPPMALVRQIAREEAALAGIDAALVLSRDRRKAVSWVRARVLQRLAEKYGVTGIAQRLELDHHTVIYAVARDLSGPIPPLRAKPGEAPPVRVRKAKEPEYRLLMCMFPPSLLAPASRERLMGCR